MIEGKMTIADVTFILYIIAFCALAYFIVNLIISTPFYKRVNENNTYEGFFGGVARGSGHPDCLRTLPESSELLDIIAAVNQDADYKELQLILSKLGCLKKDLLSPSGIVEATRYQAFDTAHDRINVAEVCGMCLNQTISSRDLDIVFATWRDRGKVLLRILCTKAHLTEASVVKTEELYKKAWEDVYDVSKSRCLKTNFSIQNGGQTGGDVGAFETENIKNLSVYRNNYGKGPSGLSDSGLSDSGLSGLSASGWNGAV